jgi:hypothetical protein
MINKIMLSSAIALMTSGCFELEPQRKWLDELEDPIPTQKEVSFCDSLKQIGYSNVSLNIPIKGVDAEGESFYILKATPPFELTKNNKDSISQVNLELANTLYKDVIEDSIMVELGTIEVVFMIKESDSKKTVRFRRSYDKREFW